MLCFAGIYCMPPTPTPPPPLLLLLLLQVCSSWDGATRCVSRALAIDPSFTDAHLLLAHVGLQQVR